jgi:hypothetical protein
MKLDKTTALFFAIRIDGKLREALACARASTRRYFDGSSTEFLRIVDLGTAPDHERWIGKVVEPGPAISQLEDVQRNVFSILKRIAPDVHFSPASAHLFVLHGVDGRLVVGEEPETVDEDSDPQLLRAC